MKKFVSTMRKGFHITFENGLEASVQWGAGNYCDNHFPEDMDFSCSKDAMSDTAEVQVVKCLLLCYEVYASKNYLGLWEINL